MLPFPTSHTKNDIHFSLFLSFWGHSEAVIVAYNEWKNEWTLIFLVCVMNKILLVLIMKCSYLTFNWHRLKFYFWYLELCFESSENFKSVESSGWIHLHYIFFLFLVWVWVRDIRARNMSREDSGFSRPSQILSRALFFLPSHIHSTKFYVQIFTRQFTWEPL